LANFERSAFVFMTSVQKQPGGLAVGHPTPAPHPLSKRLLETSFARRVFVIYDQEFVPKSKYLTPELKGLFVLCLCPRKGGKKEESLLKSRKRLREYLPQSTLAEEHLALRSECSVDVLCLEDTGPCWLTYCSVGSPQHRAPRFLVVRET